MTTTSTQDRLVTVNNMHFHYREWGDAGLPHLLILHGLTGHAWEFDAVASTVSGEFHVLVMDQRGHGGSDWAADYAPDQMVEDIAAFSEVLELRAVCIVGHSMGDVSGYLYAARYPALVDRLVIIDVGPDTFGTEWGANAFLEALRYWAQATYADPEEAIAEYLAGTSEIHAAGLRRFVLHNLRQLADGRWTWRFDAARLESFIAHAPPASRQWAELRQVTCPTLVIRAADSEALSASTAERMYRELPRGRLVEIPDSGHDLHIERFDALLSEIRGFLTTA